MIELGVGKNMVRSIRFWAECAGFIEQSADGHVPSEIGTLLFVGTGINDDGEVDQPALDAFLEDVQTLWLLHWRLATNQNSLIFAWDFLLNRFVLPDLCTTSVCRALSEAPECSSSSEGSREQMWDVFLHSYVPTRGRKGEVREDNLDCPLVELGLLVPTGSAQISEKTGRAEPKYAFRRDEKNEISNELFAFCLSEFWNNHHSDEQSIPIHLISNGHGSPGQVFKISEMHILNRLFSIRESSGGYFTFEESASIPRVVRHTEAESPALEKIYGEELAHV